MLKDIVEQIKNGEFSKANLRLEQLISDADIQISAYANYLLGYINTCRENKEKNESKARQYLRANLSSDFPHPYAYVLYAQGEKDTNIALNYLRIGVGKYPKDIRIWKKLLQLSFDKHSVIEDIDRMEFSDFMLLKDVVEILIQEGKWQEVARYINTIRLNNEFDEDEICYMDLLMAYALLFQNTPEYATAVKILEDVIEKDIDNNFEYAHYVGLVYALDSLGEKERANEYFDRIPLNNSLRDLDDGPWFVIPVNLEKEYKKIFDSLAKSYFKDTVRRNKAKELYALYLYYPLEIYGVCRYGKIQIKVLQSSLDYRFNEKIAEALYDMYYHEKQYSAANKVLLKMLKNGVNLDDSLVFYEGIVEAVSDEEWPIVLSDNVDLLEKISDEDEFNVDSYATTLFCAFVNGLFERKKYQDIVVLAEKLSDRLIIKSRCAFECAYALKKMNNSRAKIIYEMILKEEPDNSSVLNNLGIIYEEKGEIEKAYDFFERAYVIEPKDKIHINNLDRIKGKIYKKREQEIKNIAKGISLKKLEQLGYTEEILSRFKYVEDLEMRYLLERDFKECAIAVVAGQEKSAIIMCGSIIEALLLASIKKVGIERYSVNGKTKKVMDMVLNELLYVADENQLIRKRNYHLSQYVKDYRNAVHPAKEIRDQQEISNENVQLMWNALKQVIFDILHE